MVRSQRDTAQYTVWSNVIFTRTGERTPDVIARLPVTLTSVGANQAHAAGAFFRNRYIHDATDIAHNVANGVGDAFAPLRGLNPDVYSSVQTVAISLEQQYNLATAHTGLVSAIHPEQENFRARHV